MTEELHNQIMHELGEIKGKFDGVYQRLDKANGINEEHSKRLTELEKSKNYARGVVAGVSLIVSTFVSLLFYFLKK